ncbi:CFC_collapsed_G0027500.mRNA.1.CDS.1 [Saccharomyces cerevisiae]|nr:CFC_collapsed_G0027500.mRNA.1.CDS.1 [Saccharomyces cerevisiae]
MHLFLNEACIYHEFLMRRYCSMVPMCIRMWGNVRMPIVGGAEMCLEKPFSRACDASILVKKKNDLELNPHSEAYCLSLYSVFSKRLSMEEIFLSLEIRTRYQTCVGSRILLGSANL